MLTFTLPFISHSSLFLHSKTSHSNMNSSGFPFPPFLFSSISFSFLIPIFFSYENTACNMYFGFVWVEEEGAERKRKEEREKKIKKIKKKRFIYSVNIHYSFYKKKLHFSYIVGEKKKKRVIYSL
jgi:predicted permease